MQVLVTIEPNDIQEALSKHIDEVLGIETTITVTTTTGGAFLISAEVTGSNPSKPITTKRKRRTAAEIAAESKEVEEPKDQVDPESLYEDKEDTLVAAYVPVVEEDEDEDEAPVSVDSVFARSLK